MTGYETYCLYLAIKNHFHQKSYDFFKYGGKVSAKKDSFLARKDRFFFEKLARRVQSSDMKDFILANVLANRSYIIQLMDDEAQEVFKEHMRINQSLTYVFSNDLDTLMKDVDDPKQLFLIRENELPVVAQKVLSKEITMETFVILNHFIQFIPKFDDRVDDYMWEKISSRATKYAPFVNFDKSKIMKIMKEKMV